MQQPLDLTPLEWIDEVPYGRDYGGPVDVPHDPPEPPLPGESGLWWLQRSKERFPDKVAVVDGDNTLTYAELFDRVCGLRRRVGEAVQAGGVVASLMHSGLAAACAVIAGGDLGRTSLHIDATAPIERQTVLIAESRADAVIVEKGAGVDLGFLPSSVRVIEFDVTQTSGVASLEAQPASNGPARLAFTSGSTGRPKGLAFGAEDADVWVDYVRSTHLNSNDVFVSLASVSRADVVGLSVGGTLHLVDIRRLGVAEGLRRIEAAGLTVLSFVPSVLRTFLNVPGAKEAFGKLRLLSLFGERILASDIRLFRATLPDQCKISISLASTEAGSIFSWYVRDEAIDGPMAPVGYLVRSKRVALLAEGGGPAAPGQVGELIVRGPMALGSWQNGEVTSARFLPDPDDPTSKIYVTGDLVRQRPDKLFEFVGRKDRQVKIRGLWADLGEVENALMDVDNVADAVVIVRSAPGQPDALAAFITLADPTIPFDRAAARRTVRAATAEHMIPAEIRLLQTIPRLANFKPDLQRLDAVLSEAPAKRAAAHAAG